jgi:type I restriction enzyme M protein
LRNSSEHSLRPSDTAELTALEALAIARGEKLYLRCQARQREILAKPEEAIRQLWILRLTAHYGYPLNRIAVEYPITFGRDTSKRADIVVFDQDRPTVPYLIIEVKQGKARDGKEQLRSYTHATGAPLALWSNGVQTIAWHRKNPNYFVEIPDIPTAGQTIDDVAGEPWTVATLVEKEKDRERGGTKARSFARPHCRP